MSKNSMMGLTALALLIVGIVAGIVIYPMFSGSTTPLCENVCPTCETCPNCSPCFEKTPPLCENNCPEIDSTLPQGEAPLCPECPDVVKP